MDTKNIHFLYNHNMNSYQLNISIPNSIKLLTALSNNYKELKQHIQETHPNIHVKQIQQIQINNIWIPIGTFYNNITNLINIIEHHNTINFTITHKTTKHEPTIKPSKIFTKTKTWLSSIINTKPKNNNPNKRKKHNTLHTQPKTKKIPKT